MPNPAGFGLDMKLYRAGSFEPASVLPVHGFDQESRGVGAAELAWSLRLGRQPRADVSLGLHCQEIIQGIQMSSETGKSYQMTTSCERPEPLPRGFRGMPMLAYPEEGSLAL